MRAGKGPVVPLERPELVCGTLVLRAPRAADVAARLAAGGHPEIVRMYGGDLQAPTPISPADAERWYARLCADPLAWVIEVDGRCTGVVRLHTLVERDRRARLAIGLLEPELLGRGIGTRAIRCLLRHAFETMRLHRVDLRVLAFNGRAIRCYERCGFVREGRERESAWVGGGWADDVLMSILEHEYHALVAGWTC